MSYWVKTNEFKSKKVTVSKIIQKTTAIVACRDRDNNKAKIFELKRPKYNQSFMNASAWRSKLPMVWVLKRDFWQTFGFSCTVYHNELCSGNKHSASCLPRSISQAPKAKLQIFANWLLWLNKWNFLMTLWPHDFTDLQFYGKLQEAIGLGSQWFKFSFIYFWIF